jgi:hypothetical protein
VVLHVGDVLGVGGVGEDAAVDLRVQRDHTVAEDRREAGEFGDVGDGTPASAIARAVPPLETIDQPSCGARRAKSTMPDLS